MIKRLIQNGTTPSLAELCNHGIVEAHAPLPPISSVSWASATTGVNPGRHGIFGFVERKPESYGVSFTSSERIRVPRVWDVVARAGMKSLVINVPGTYPADPLNGIMVAGFVSPVFERAVWPRDLADVLKPLGYAVDVDLSVGHTDLAAFVEQLFAAHAARRAGISQLLARIEWDLAYIAFTGTDRLHHFLWGQMEDGIEPWAGAFQRYYTAVDEAVAELVEQLPPDTDILVMSDHGFCRLEREIFVNRLLERDGWLVLERPGTELTQIDPRRTRAYALDPSRIYVNLRGREPGGSVARADRPRVIEELVAWAADLTWVDFVARQEDAFVGENLEQAPDLILVPKRGSDPKAALRGRQIESASTFTGMHTFDDAFVAWANRRIDDGPVRVESVAATALHLLGFDTSGLDGSVFGESDARFRPLDSPRLAPNR